MPIQEDKFTVQTGNTYLPKRREHPRTSRILQARKARKCETLEL
jgi:hypothetical protein